MSETDSAALRGALSAHLPPPLVFVPLYRLPFDTPDAWRRERRSVHAANLSLVS